MCSGGAGHDVWIHTHERAMQAGGWICTEGGVEEGERGGGEEEEEEEEAQEEE